MTNSGLHGMHLPVVHRQKFRLLETVVKQLTDG